jgi:hypothetical protein
MSDNPLEPNAARDQRIRERAYHLWEEEGRPEGREAEYWERAEELVGMEDSPNSGQLPRDYEVKPDEAEIQENLGEFPDRLSDQGEHPATPAVKRRRA